MKGKQKRIKRKNMIKRKNIKADELKKSKKKAKEKNRRKSKKEIKRKKSKKKSKHNIFQKLHNCKGKIGKFYILIPLMKGANSEKGIFK